MIFGCFRTVYDLSTFVISCCHIIHSVCTRLTLKCLLRVLHASDGWLNMIKRLNNPNGGATVDEYMLKNATIQAFTKPTSKEMATFQEDEKQQLVIMSQKLSLMSQLQGAYSSHSATFDLTVANLTLQLNQLEVLEKQLQVHI